MALLLSLTLELPAGVNVEGIIIGVVCLGLGLFLGYLWSQLTDISYLVRKLVKEEEVRKRAIREAAGSL